MKAFIIIITFFFFISCSERPIFYEYEGVTITRIDKSNGIYFFYGKCPDIKSDCRKSYIKATYRGFNSGMQGYIVFNNDKTVKVISNAAYFEQIGENTNLYLSKKKENSTESSNWIRKAYEIGYPNVRYISDSINEEKEKNERKISDVKATYPNGE